MSGVKYLTQEDIELCYAGRTYSETYLTKKVIEIRDLEFWSEVPID